MIQNLRNLFHQADKTDRTEGELAYRRYHELLASIADHYGFAMPAVVGAFVALSPNSDYQGNLRSLVSVIVGVKRGLRNDQIVVSTYKHCQQRAFWYMTGKHAFLDHAKGLKTRAFYSNILDPSSQRFVTVDGHMHAAWAGKDWTMRQAIVTDKTYHMIAHDIKALAFEYGLLPNQMQATLWFARKRLQQIRYVPQLDLFHGGHDQWRTFPAIRDIRPYPTKGVSDGPRVSRLRDRDRLAGNRVVRDQGHRGAPPGLLDRQQTDGVVSPPQGAEKC